jgi:hypothetical protein
VKISRPFARGRWFNFITLRHGKTNGDARYIKSEQETQQDAKTARQRGLSIQHQHQHQQTKNFPKKINVFFWKDIWDSLEADSDAEFRIRMVSIGKHWKISSRGWESNPHDLTVNGF